MQIVNSGYQLKKQTFKGNLDKKEDLTQSQKQPNFLKMGLVSGSLLTLSGISYNESKVYKCKEKGKAFLELSKEMKNKKGDSGFVTYLEDKSKALFEKANYKRKIGSITALCFGFGFTYVWLSSLKNIYDSLKKNNDKN